MKIINTTKEIMQYFPDKEFNLQNWKSYTKEFSNSLNEKCLEDAKEYNFNEEVLPVFNHALKNDKQIQAISTTFTKVTNNLIKRMSILFDKDIELDIILYLGLCNGAGWATTLDNKNAILLGIEKIIELNWGDEETFQSLVFHEIGHIWHKLYGELYLPVTTQGEKNMLQLYQEGVAMICEQILSNNCSYHQDKNGWLNWCKKNKTKLNCEFLNRVKNNETAADFFGDWNSYKGHSDVGYYLGCEFIRHLQNKYTLIKVANLSLDILMNEFEKYALREEEN